MKTWTPKIWRGLGEDVDDASEPEEESPSALGLFVLHPPLQLQGSDFVPEVDIVAVHGLNGSARKTWTDKNTGHFWLEDSLPQAVPRGRVMTFGYDSTLVFSKSKAGIETFANDLLIRLRIERSKNMRANVPLIFIAHSLGGIVVKKALVMAHEAEKFHGDILRLTKGIIFMGTPHRGSDLVPWSLLLSNLINVASLGRGVRKDLLKNLEKDGKTLLDISSQFVHRATPLQIRSLVEQQVERPLNTLVVPESSAVLGLPNELVVPLNAHHRGMCCFSSSESQNLIIVQALIKELIPRDLDEPKNLKSSIDITSLRHPTSSNQISGKRLVRKVSTICSGRSYESARRRSELLPAPNASGGSLQPLRDNRPVSPNLKLRTGGLRRRLSVTNCSAELMSCEFDVPNETEIAHLQAGVADKKTNVHFRVRSCSFRVSEHAVKPTPTDVSIIPVETTAGRPSDRTGELKINHRQSIASFFSKVFPKPLEANLDPESRPHSSTSPSKVASTSISIRQEGKTSLRISFARAVRIPENGKTYNEMEAIWIDLHCTGDDKFALQQFLAGVNGNTGEKSIGDMTSLIRRINELATLQDHLVLPDQLCQNGISTSPGIVRQFADPEMVPPHQAEPERARGMPKRLVRLLANSKPASEVD